MRLTCAILVTAALAAAGAAPAAAQDSVPPGPDRAATIAARSHFFGAANVDRRTGAVRSDRVILSWFGVSSFAMAIRGHVVLLDAWVPRGAHSGYVPTTVAELVALRPSHVFIGHGHFDHAADAAPVALAAGARIVGTAEHCRDLRRRIPGRKPRCLPVMPATAPPGRIARPTLMRGVQVTIVRNVHSAGTPADGEFEPVTFPPSTTQAEYPPTPEDRAHAERHLPDPEGGALLYRFQTKGLTLVWHDSSGPLEDRAPRLLRLLARLRPVDVHVGAIVGFNMFSNGFRDPIRYADALRARLFVAQHHDDWFPPALSTTAANLEGQFRSQWAQLPAARRPRLRYLLDRRDYLRPGPLTFAPAARSDATSSARTGPR